MNISHLYIRPSIHCYITKKCKESRTKRTPSLFVPIFVHTKEIITHIGKQEHKEEKKDDDVDHPTANSVNKSDHQNLQQCNAD